MQFFRSAIRKAVLSAFTLLAFSTAFGQFIQLEKFKQRRDRAVTAAEEREKAKNGDNSATKTAGPKIPVMNVDVQMVLTRNEHANYAEAKPNSVLKITDGEPLWMYVRFNGKLGDYVAEAEKGDDGKPRYSLFAEIGPQGDVTALNRFVIVFRDEDLKLTELKINLAPGLRGRNASIPLVLDRAAVANPGVWQNEIRLSNMIADPRPLTSNLANATLAFDLSRGAAAYKRQHTGYDSVLFYGTYAAKSLPAAGRFESERIRQQILATLLPKLAQPVNMYFVSDDWMESFAFVPTKDRKRSVLAAFTYSDAGKCFQGTVRVEEKFDDAKGTFGNTQVAISDGRSIACTELK